MASSVTKFRQSNAQAQALADYAKTNNMTVSKAIRAILADAINEYPNEGISQGIRTDMNKEPKQMSRFAKEWAQDHTFRNTRFVTPNHSMIMTELRYDDSLVIIEITNATHVRGECALAQDIEHDGDAIVSQGEYWEYSMTWDEALSLNPIPYNGKPLGG